MTEYRMGDGKILKVNWTDTATGPDYIALAGVSGNRQVYLVECKGTFRAVIAGRSGIGLSADEALWNTRR